MLTWLRRFVVFGAVAIWLGGFAVYGGLVVPVGRAVFDDKFSLARFSLVTVTVTTYLNVLCFVALAALAWDGVACRDRDARRKRGRWLTWVAAAVALVTLFGLHFWLDWLMTQHEVSAQDPVFYPVHRAYLIIGTLQWLAGVVNAGLLLASWRDEDRQTPSTAPAAPPG